MERYLALASYYKRYGKFNVSTEEDLKMILEMVFYYLNMPLEFFGTEVSIFKICISSILLSVCIGIVHWLFTR